MSNRETLNTYETHVQEYIDGTPQEVSGHVKEWIDDALSHIEKGSTVLELGSAFGRDAAYIEQQGYVVDRTDATQAFVDLLKAQGHTARNLNAITDDYGQNYSAIFADAVLLHFTKDEFGQALGHVKDCLKPQGIFALTLKKGTGSEWSEEKLRAPRFFQYWQETEVEQVLTQAGFSVFRCDADDADKWIQVIARKES